MRPNGRVPTAAAFAVTIPSAGWLTPLAAKPTAALPALAPTRTGGVEMLGPPSQGTASLAGTVVHAESGKPIARARVTATSPVLPAARATVKGASGRFEFSGLPAGRCTLAVTRTVSR
jgi:hypothetical protein